MKNYLNISLLLAIVFSLLQLSCERPTSPPKPNSPPITTLANIPRDSSVTDNPLTTLYWNGGDSDGFIQGYQYRYITYHRSSLDTSKWNPFDSTNWTYTKETSILIAFNSIDELNLQKFMVRAVDNNGAVSPEPKVKILFTKKTYPPLTTILSPANYTKMLALETVTDWWPGVHITFKARPHPLDPKAKVISYGWSVDNQPIHWGKDTSIFIKPIEFKSPLYGFHTINVRSKNITNLEDSVGATITIELLKAKHERGILIINETDMRSIPFVFMEGMADSVIDKFYNEMFQPDTTWHYIRVGRMPTRDYLAQFKLVIWHADDQVSAQPHKIALSQNVEIIQDYLNTGGKFVMSGWRILKSFNWYENTNNYQPGSFVHDYLHIKQSIETTIMGDFIEGRSPDTTKFHHVKVDSVKLAPLFGSFGKLSYVNLITVRGGFTDILFAYKNSDDSPFVEYRGRTCALRYYGTSFDAAIFGFPMFFIEKSDAIRLGREIKRNFNVN